MRALAPQVTTWLAVLFAGWALVTALLRWRARPVPRWLGVVGVVIASVPVGTFLANLVPWWRVEASGVAFVATLAAVVAGTAGVAVLAGRRTDLGALRAVAVVTMLVSPLLVDLADKLCTASFGGETLAASTRLAYAAAGAPYRYLAERKTR